MANDSMDIDTVPETPTAMYDDHIGNIVLLSDALQRVYAAFRSDKELAPLEMDRYKRQKDLLLKLLESSTTVACLSNELAIVKLKKEFPKNYIFTNPPSHLLSTAPKVEIINLKKDS